ncbi:hypothetical protein K227x_11890 [Rubripirellula lacrimiformis]|uniref:Gamma-butyrobetaine hydroxylase-like N-terminal domain-containing protein n=2 Tax=Rubripirellula lacrimiformis TaxID=1930273 RepID=A0A517N6R9_9BACT|nr:hypothetical protein K227x_11890 [Rubripirellula lacrimiformis]
MLPRDPQGHQPKPTETDRVPESIQRDGDTGITITWNDGSATAWTNSQLRKACPCATCREKKRGLAEKAKDTSGPIGLPVLSAAEAKPLRIDSMRPVGSYAYNIAFSDGHDSGIFPFVLLHEGPDGAA